MPEWCWLSDPFSTGESWEEASCSQTTLSPQGFPLATPAQPKASVHFAEFAQMDKPQPPASLSPARSQGGGSGS